VFTRLSDVRKGLTFYAVVFALVVTVSVLPLGQVALPVAMMMPAVAVLLMLLVITRDGYSRAGWASLGLHRLGVKAWPLAVLAPLTVLGVAYGIVWASGMQRSRRRRPLTCWDGSLHSVKARSRTSSSPHSCFRWARSWAGARIYCQSSRRRSAIAAACS
jgi:hypothetical protein